MRRFKSKPIPVASLQAAKSDLILASSKFVLPFNPEENQADPAILFWWAQERHKVFLARAKGFPPPWTENPLFNNFRFCNTYREIDSVSYWIRKNILYPYRTSPHLWFMVVISRFINTIDCMNDLMRSGQFAQDGQFNPEKFYAVLARRKSRGEQVFTGAYLINGVAPANCDPRSPGNKAAIVTFDILAPLWESFRKGNVVQANFTFTLETCCETLMEFHGLGDFLSYQIAQDLTYVPGWLAKAPDRNTFNLPGPGTRRGLQRVFSGGKGKEFRLSPDVMSDSIQELYKTQHLHFNSTDVHSPSRFSANLDHWSTGYPDLTLGNISNSLCEFDKTMRLFLGEGRMRSKFVPSERSQLQLL